MYLCVILQCTLYPKERVLSNKEKYLKKKTYNFYNKYLPRFLLNDFYGRSQIVVWLFAIKPYTQDGSLCNGIMPRAFWEGSDIGSLP